MDLLSAFWLPFFDFCMNGVISEDESLILDLLGLEEKDMFTANGRTEFGPEFLLWKEPL